MKTNSTNFRLKCQLKSISAGEGVSEWAYRCYRCERTNINATDRQARLAVCLTVDILIHPSAKMSAAHTQIDRQISFLDYIHLVFRQRLIINTYIYVCMCMGCCWLLSKVMCDGQAAWQPMHYDGWRQPMLQI